MDLSLVERAVERALGISPARARLIPTEGESVVCEVELSSGTVFFKADWTNVLRVQGWYAERFLEHRIPTPAMLAFDDTSEIFPSAFAIFERAAGRPLGRISLDETPSSALSSELGALLRTIHEIEVEGVGWIRLSEAGEARGMSGGWAEMFRDQAAWGLTYAFKHDLLAPGVVERIWEAVRGAEAMLESAGPWRLLHGDLRPDHVFHADGHVSAIIDMHGRIGDPVYDFAHYAVQTGPGSLELLLAGYDPDADLQVAIAERLPLYEVVEMTGILRWLHEHPGASTARIVDVFPSRIADRVAAL